MTNDTEHRWPHEAEPLVAFLQNTRALLAVLIEELDLGEIGIALQVAENLHDDLGDQLAVITGAMPAQRKHRCTVCEMAFRWPGELEGHTFRAHSGSSWWTWSGVAA